MKSTNPVILSIMHHLQNPLDSTCLWRIPNNKFHGCDTTPPPHLPNLHFELESFGNCNRIGTLEAQNTDEKSI
jgi:hypothetical protein